MRDVLRATSLVVTGAAGLLILAATSAAAADEQAPPVRRFDVPLPITDAVEKSVTKTVEQALRKLPADGPRPKFIFEFRPSGGAGDERDFGDVLGLARFLSGERLSRVNTIAYVPKSIEGHAVLPVLACEQIIIAKEASLGPAGAADAAAADATIRGSYVEIAQRHRTVPAAIAQGLLDKALAVSKVTLVENKGVRYETADDVKKLREQGAVSVEETIFEPGQRHSLSGPKMRELGFATHLAEDRRALAAALQLPVGLVERDVTPEEGWRAIRVDLRGPVHKQSINWVLRSLQDHERRGDFNLLVLCLDTAGGDLDQSRRLAEHLASMSDSINTVAFVDRQARADAALIALACKELVMHPAATLGGPGEQDIRESELAAARPALQEMFARLARDWSLPLALLDPNIEIHGYRHSVSGDVRYLSADEALSIGNIADWQRDERAVNVSGGLSAATAEELGLSRATASNFADLKSLYQIEGDLNRVRPNWALALVEWLADPRIAGVLLFVGGFALLFELSTPGVSLPGFIAVICFLLFFWSQFLHGTAGWLEVLLFVGGLACLAVEAFALPGMGVFGFGGGLMVIASIVLASQTFVVPTNAYQMRQFPISLLMLAAGMTGGIASVLVIRRYLPDTPYFNRMLLKPPRPEEREALSRREAMVSWDHLHNKRGLTVTPLVPAGKAQFGDDVVDCISNGELIAKGTPVVVEEITGSRVVVRKINP
jgi:membrane-bound serine protease (ClpP class)